MIRIGVDIGGTFTDFAIWRDEADGYSLIESHKVATTRPDFAAGVKAGIAELAARHGVVPGDPLLVIHGTTVSTNAVIERSEPTVALLTTTGFRDLLEIARLRLNKPVDLFNRRPEPLTPREHVFTIGGRLLADGREDQPLDEPALLAALAEIQRRGIGAVAICFMNSYVNPAHERAARDLAAVHFPDLDLVLSSDVWPQQAEYERATLTLLNAYVKPLMRGYIGELEAWLAAQFPGAQLQITKSNGGIMSAAEAMSLPVHTLLSGPAAGVTAARNLGAMLDVAGILTFDMGGTSADVSLISAGRSVTAGQAEVGDFPLMMPVTSVEAMGAGGGSIVRLDDGVMKVGPRSMGSRPGPACYGLGGTLPTLSDAYLLTGYLPASGLLGGSMALDPGLAEAAFAPLAEAVNLSVIETADAAIRVATAGMMARITPFLARMGVGAGDLSLMIFGGAGGIHGPILADDIGIRHIIIPRTPSVFCALGGLVSDLVHDSVCSLQGAGVDPQQLKASFADLLKDGEAWLQQQSSGEALADTRFELLAEMRHAAQSFPILVDLTAAMAAGADAAALAQLFHDQHARLFGHSDPAGAVVIDTLRVRSTGQRSKPAPLGHAGGTAAPQPVASRDLHVNGQWHRAVPVWSQSDLAVGWQSSGPAIIQQDLATVYVPAGYAVGLTPFGDIDMRRL